MLRRLLCIEWLLAVIIAAASDAPAATSGRAPEELGKVAFENSCTREVQESLQRGVALLHSFWFEAGEAAFKDALARDPGCAVANWGIASIQIGNTFAPVPTEADTVAAMKAIEKGRSIGAKSERERLYIEAVARYFENSRDRTPAERMRSLSDAFADLARLYPGDDEAQIFNALYLAATQQRTEPTFERTLKAAAILEIQFKKHPDHPGVAHYLIHSYDYPPIAAKGLDAARRYAGIAPSAPHALHMPSHIFTRVGAWQDSIETNLRSARVSRAEKEFGQQLHAMDYMVYAYLQLGRDADAERIVREEPSVRTPEKALRTPYARAAIPARFVVERDAWSEAAQLRPVESRFPYVSALTLFARALGAARDGNPAAAEADTRELARIAQGLRDARDTYWAAEVEVQRLAAEGWVAYKKGERAEGLRLMRAAAQAEDLSEKSGVSPGRLIPARELLGDMLLDDGKPAEALAEYERSLVRDANRFRSFRGASQAAAKAGNEAQARYYSARLAELAAGGTRALH